MNPYYEEAQKVKYMRAMLLDHMNNHVEQALALAIYVFKWPPKYIRLLESTDRPFRQVVLDSPGLVSILLEVELKPNPLDPRTVDTYIRGDIADLITYNKMKGGD